MSPALFVLSTDLDRIEEITTYAPRDLRVEPLFPRDSIPRGPIAGLIIDLDYLLLDRPGRRWLVEQARRWVARFPVAVFSFNLDEEQETALRSLGVILARSLDPTVVIRLLGLPPAASSALRPAA